MFYFQFEHFNEHSKCSGRTRTDVRYMFDFTCLIGARIDLEVPFHTKIMVPVNVIFEIFSRFFVHFERYIYGILWLDKS